MVHGFVYELFRGVKRLNIAGLQIEKWIADFPSNVHIKKRETVRTDIQQKLNMKDDSFLGYIVGNYDEFDCCDGYIHLLCGGEESIEVVNAIGRDGLPQLFPGALVVAYDTNGNLFSINAGAAGNSNLGNVLYMSKEGFWWEDLEIHYAEFIKWLIHVTEEELTSCGWKSGAPLGEQQRIFSYIMGKAAAYNMFLKQKG